MSTYKWRVPEYEAVQFDGKNTKEVKDLVGDTSEGNTISVGTGVYDPAKPPDQPEPVEKRKPLVVKAGDWVVRDVVSNQVEVNPEGFPEEYNYSA